MAAYSQKGLDDLGLPLELGAHRARRMTFSNIGNAAIVGVTLATTSLSCLFTTIVFLAADYPNTVRQWVDFLASRSTIVVVFSAIVWIVVAVLAILAWRIRAIARMEQEIERTDQALSRAERYGEMIRRVSAVLAMRGQATTPSAHT